MATRWIVAAILLVFVGAGGVNGDADTRSYPGIARAQQDMRLKFSVSGRVTAVLVREGQRVSEGEVLVRLDDRDAREQVAALRLRAQSTIEIDSAQAALDLATNEEQRVRDAFENGGANEFELRRAELATLQAGLTLALRQRQQQEAGTAYRRAEITLEEYTCLSPIDGVVEEIAIEAGELIERHAPIVRVVQPDPLRIEVDVATDATLRLERGDLATVRVSLLGIEEQFFGKIVRFAEVADSASGTRLVIIEAPKPGDIPAGVRVVVEFAQNQN